MDNPFTPSFGIVPPYLAGRSSILKDMKRAFGNWPGDPNLSTILIGPRGSGKTAMLSCIGDEARRQGWIVVDTVADKYMLDDILQNSLSIAADHIGENGTIQLTGLNIGSFLGLSWTADTADELSWRMKMRELLRKLRNLDIGLLITVDEVRADLPEMIHFASSYQLFKREGTKIALVLAGLPVHVSDLISNDDVSFLRRARQKNLGRIPDADVRSAFRKTVESAGKTIEPEALDLAVEASDGFAFMIQLVGYSIWDESGEQKHITAEHALQGIRYARKDFRAGVLVNTWRELSAGDKNFLLAMVQDDDGGATLTSVAKRMGKTTGYASTYKKRLERAGVIEQLTGDTLVFAMPAMREYAAEHLTIQTPPS